MGSISEMESISVSVRPADMAMSWPNNGRLLKLSLFRIFEFSVIHSRYYEFNISCIFLPFEARHDDGNHVSFHSRDVYGHGIHTLALPIGELAGEQGRARDYVYHIRARRQ